MNEGKTQTYNERLFQGRGLRSRLHNARFNWMRRVLAREGHTPRRVLEIGCFDGKLLDFLPAAPDRYVGLDAGWEKGTELARRRFSNSPNYQLIIADNPGALAAVDGEQFDLGVAMETLEHVPPDRVEGYLHEFANRVSGLVLVTVPNEKGPVLLVKWLVKRLFYGGAESYSFTELVAATLGRMERVRRNEHKGFDYSALVRQMECHFDMLRVEPIPALGLPLFLSFGIGIVARTRRARLPPAG